MKMDGKLIIRRAAQDDLDAVACVWRASALRMDGRTEVPSAEALRARVDRELRAGWVLYVAAFDERIVGLLAIKPAKSILDQIFVLPAEQGKGVGAALMATARSKMPGGFSLRMAASNEQARRFYEREGLNSIGEGLHPLTGIPVLYYAWVVR